ncbi:MULTISPECIES: DUF3124 domain-containing protein [Leptolyngbya]|jgi:hypothetical protein|uniref:DUF3124 domain-containing protein n=2 Tax=Leptolyngbya boryana TaxID=1184 RepID=A0A1Z4JH10_LEPBY|nr:MULTISPECIES: DUF3124 domain-containing protein [Leptolyngbya]BAY56055.1 hypothetical protein NIES2135_28830 [Leptolyngbya boryana NIES-2135]MBN8559809.1 DUF3124 domain-containing protein [Leptolyngbya sp. UWPOB_LEPTO1]MCY6491568.1 DUF3124 domain-containing protein [Leptolyngbya sp. GGD]ULP32926.1 DUF3124 domain-containing protein [Leptolyngbya boryana IU 594]WNZ45013.1 DUF3124 domain-containing protein [Leptolyngbya boryana CZ1]
MIKRYFCLAIVGLILLGCKPEAELPPTPQLKTVTLTNSIKIARGQTVYVPVYSHIYSISRSQKMDLSVTLSVRNTDQSHPMIITSVFYHDTNGKLIRKYLEQPVELRPLASTYFFVDQADTGGGAGASFLVEWVAQQKVTDPVIETVMINTMGNQGISFVSEGRVIKRREASTSSK